MTSPSTPYLGPDEIARTVRRLGHEIIENNRGTADLVLVGLLSRGYPIARRLATAIQEFEGVAVPVGGLDIGLYRDEPTFGDLERELRDQGFMFHDFDFLKRVPLAGSHAKGLRRTVYRQVVDGDAFFVRDLTRAAGMSDTQLWRLALLAEAVVRSPSLVLFCLETLVARGRADGDLPERYLGLSPAKWRR